MTMTTLSTQPGWQHRTIYDGALMRLEYFGPASPDQVIVVFPPFDFPFVDNGQGWGGASFAKRNLAYVCVYSAKPDWYQNAEFFDAMQACRREIDGNSQISAYGFSMGGYGALLAGRTLDAKRIVAGSPQVSIDPKIATFERRYDKEWSNMDGWHHNLAREMDHHRDYFVIFDPLHRMDKMHEDLLPKPAGYRRCMMHGVGHGILKACVEMGLQDELFELIHGKIEANQFRTAFRGKRPSGFRYLRKVGSEMHDRGHKTAPLFLDLAAESGYDRLVRRWQKYYNAT